MNEMEELKRKIREKDEKLKELMKQKPTPPNENDLKIKCSNLESENINLRDQVLAIEKKIKEQQSLSIDNKLNEFKQSLNFDDKEYNYAFDDLKNHLNKNLYYIPVQAIPLLF